MGDCTESGSVRQVDAVCGTHTYTVVGYTLARAMGPGSRLCSDLFEVGGQLFRLEVYPAGINAEAHKYVSLFLTTSGTTRPGHLLFELSILDKGGPRPLHISESRTAHPPPSSPSEPAAIQAPHAGVLAGFPKFIKANFLHRNARRFLPDDTLAVRATVRVLTGRSSFPVTQPAQPQLFSLQPSPAAQLHAQSTPLPLPVYGTPTVNVLSAAASACAEDQTPPGLYARSASCRCGYGSGYGYGCGNGSFLASSQAGGPLRQQHPQALLPYVVQQQPQQQPQALMGAIAVAPFPGSTPAPSMLLPAQMPYLSFVHPLAMSG